MKPLQIGSISVERLVETESPIMEPDFLFPDATHEAILAESEWLQPYFVDPLTGKLIMSFHTYVIRTEDSVILVDTCVGNNKSRPHRPFWHLLNTPYISNLSTMGVEREEVDFVMCTHLHADHVGWNTQLLDGRWVPTFPNARYIFAKNEYEFWEGKRGDNSTLVNHGAFADSVLPVVEAGQAVMVDSDYSLNDNIWFEPAPGHTPGNISINISSGGDRAVLCGDTIHHAAQLRYPEWSSRFCEDPIQSFSTRQNLIESLADSATFLLAAHFPSPTAGRIVSYGESFRFKLRT